MLQNKTTIYVSRKSAMQNLISTLCVIALVICATAALRLAPQDRPLFARRLPLSEVIARAEREPKLVDKRGAEPIMTIDFDW
ncbi:hypothetical protein Ciccas_009624 [Cichlidogyrus casuarinus]|uniref:Uncharacterized protein n=1 Tax=Cichlidogyrus casuarinus TaxID=1844966 RepID=A0ABD2PWI7_9PLAT